MNKYILLSFLFFTFLTPQKVLSQQAGCYSEQGDAYWYIGSQYGSRRLSDCHLHAFYNCHGFVMSYFEYGCTEPDYLGIMVPAPYTCPNSTGCQSGVCPSASAYQTNIRYVQVCTESAGEIVYYGFQAGDHSAVKQIINPVLGTVKYLSKYNYNGPLVGHDLNGSWYHYQGQTCSNPEFWSYIGEISGNTNIVGTGLTSFSVLNKPEVIYAWSIVSGYSNIYISSGANQSTVTLKPTHSGTAVLKFSVSSNCASVINANNIKYPNQCMP